MDSMDNTTTMRKQEKKRLKKLRRILLLSEPNFVDSLRAKFVEQAKTYFGTPYAKRYWKPEEPEYNSKKFLDCCGLVRRVQSDLRHFFGFVLGPWNQAYMFDTLPKVVHSEAEMRPGDLVFISGIYNKPNMKHQKHNMVHVEIWAGDGVKTIGARWQRGKVQVFNDYRFDAKSFHSAVYHFRSLDSWLHGKCKSHCDEHKWIRRVHKPKKKSIFNAKIINDSQSGRESCDTVDSQSDSPTGIDSQSNSSESCDINSQVEDVDDNFEDAEIFEDAETVCDENNFDDNDSEIVEEDNDDDDSDVDIDNENDDEFRDMNDDDICEANDDIVICETSNDVNRNMDLSEHDDLKSLSQNVDLHSQNVTSLPKHHPCLSKDLSLMVTELDLLEDGDCRDYFIFCGDEECDYKCNSFIFCENLPCPVTCSDNKSEGYDSNFVDMGKKGLENGTINHMCEMKSDRCHNVDNNEQNCFVNNKSDTFQPRYSKSECDLDSLSIQEDYMISRQFKIDCVPVVVSSKQFNELLKQETRDFLVKLVRSEIDMNKGDMYYNENMDDLKDMDLKDTYLKGYSKDGHSKDTVFIDKDLKDGNLKNKKHLPSRETRRGSQSPVKVHNGIRPFSEKGRRNSNPDSNVALVKLWDDSKVKRHEQDSKVDRLKQDIDSNEQGKIHMKDQDDSNNRVKHSQDSKVDCEKYQEQLDQNQQSENVDQVKGITRCSDESQSTSKSGTSVSNTGTTSESTSENRKSDDDRDDPDESGDRKRRGRRRGTKSIPPSLAACQPHFYVGGGNGTALVAGPLEALGWKRTTDKYNENYKLKWVECKSKINYAAFKEGEQLVNHIPNCQLLTNKLGLLVSLRDYETLTMNIKGRAPPLKMSDFFPETYNLNDKNDRESFFKVMKDNETWICKPAGMNQGKGIYLIRSRDEIAKILEERDLKQAALQVKRPFVLPIMPRIIQRYITNPLLLEERKFDIRTYMLIASTSPFVVLYHKGYVRLSCNKYDGEDLNLTTHLTNQYIQKKDPAYQEVKEDTAWSMDKLNEYFNDNLVEEKGLEMDWVNKQLTKQMQKIMVHCFHSVKNKLQSKVGYFDLYGLDFMVDTDMKVWLIEINVNPALHINCAALKDVIPGVVEETLNLSIECFEKSRRHQPVFPLKSLSNFTLLNTNNQPCGSVRASKPRVSSPAHAVSPSHGTSPSHATSPSHTTSQTRLVSKSAPRLSVSPSRELSPIARHQMARSQMVISRPLQPPTIRREYSQVKLSPTHTTPPMSIPLKPTNVSIQFKLTHAEGREREKRDRDRSDRGN